MSWISQNYEKASVGVAVIAAAGLAFMGWQKVSSVEENFGSQPSGPKATQNDPSVKDADLVSTAIASFQLTRQWAKGEDNGRAVDLFTGVPLFVNKNNPETPVDLNGENVEPVHPPIPNAWWIENRIDPGYGDSPARDEDEDGFSNIDEFTAKTDPGDKRDFPALLSKLTYKADEAVTWVLRPGFPGANGEFTFEYSDTLRRAAKVPAANPVLPEGLFFAEGPIKDRFKLIGSEKRKVLNEKLNVEIETVFVTVEDQKPNKKGTKYEIPSNFRRADAGKFTQADRTAVLTLEALGLDGQEFKVEEFTRFALPPTAENKDYLIREITPETITIEHTGKDGKVVTSMIQKGAMGPEAP